MKKVIIVFIGIILLLFISRYTMVLIDYRYNNSLEKEILNNTDLNNIKYINKYDNYYLVKDNNNLYLFNLEYEEILRVNLDIVYNNIENYDIVYREQRIMYMDNYMNEEGIIYKYYDIYTYEMIDEVIVEVSNE